MGVVGVGPTRYQRHPFVGKRADPACVFSPYFLGFTLVFRHKPGLDGVSVRPAVSEKGNDIAWLQVYQVAEDLALDVVMF
jgi:hypothetical protein